MIFLAIWTKHNLFAKGVNKSEWNLLPPTAYFSKDVAKYPAASRGQMLPPPGFAADIEAMFNSVATA